MNSCIYLELFYTQKFEHSNIESYKMTPWKSDKLRYYFAFAFTLTFPFFVYILLCNIKYPTANSVLKTAEPQTLHYVTYRYINVLIYKWKIY